MTLRASSVALLCLSWFASAIVGGIVARKWEHAASASYNTLKAKHLEIVDNNGTGRIALGMEHNQPSILLLSSSQAPLLRFSANLDIPSDSASAPILVPVIELNDGMGRPSIQMFGNHDQRGLIAFSSPRIEGKVMLGHFGISDDGTDTGMWGMEVMSRLKGMHTNRMMGVMTFNGDDTQLVWPEYTLGKK